MNSFSFCFILNFFSLFWYCFNSQDFKVIRRIKRQSSCYTQGLEFNSDGTLLYESCGLYSQSSIRT
ncbi:MAG: glutaminyl-peptide cyclotransferase, partial [archaeon]|nr:glutaminyl-peptide cyclotransferase [archaeon]